MPLRRYNRESTENFRLSLSLSVQFGKGVYFADMCSKSANYCFASRARQDGLLILCDVALGIYTVKSPNKGHLGDFKSASFIQRCPLFKGTTYICNSMGQNQVSIVEGYAVVGGSFFGGLITRKDYHESKSLLIEGQLLMSVCRAD